jgi:two-component system, chemotaxis family, protein-glutamate methylesterase/glutaminase
MKALAGRKFDAVVIGASAGGVEALSVLLSALPANFPAAVLIVIHLPPGRPSLLVEIFARKCALPVREADDKEPVTPGAVWFAPPDYHLLVDQGPQGRPQFALTVDALVNYSRPAIDPLFESAADGWRERVLGIVLTGASQDGAAGLHAVLAQGGGAIVQDPAEAQVAVMPQAAADRCPEAVRMTLAQIAETLRQLAAP